MKFRNLLKKLARPAAIAAFTLVAAPALAATAQVTADLNLRAGPSTRYPVIGSVPYGHTLTVYGCLQGYSWCDVSYRGARGWVSANYLNYRYANNWRPIPYWGSRIGVPVIAFSFGDYSYRHYRNYDWYRHRDRWMGHNDRRHDNRDWQRDRNRHDGRRDNDRRWDQNAQNQRPRDWQKWQQWQQQQGGLVRPR